MSAVVLAEIRVPENRQLDTHNLGKSTVGELIDFCLLKGRDNGLLPLSRMLSGSRSSRFILELEARRHAFLHDPSPGRSRLARRFQAE